MCNGIRDPTIFLPISALASPWGLDHDYNFIHGIETQISRTEKVLIEDLDIVGKNELEAARAGETLEMYNRRVGVKSKEPQGEACIERVLREEGIRVVKAPRGMRRAKENATTWNKKQKSVNWQVEWVREGKERSLYRALGSRPLGDFYEAMCEEQRQLALTEEERREERRVEKRRRADKTKEMGRKRARIETSERWDLTSTTRMQDVGTGAWNLTPVYSALDEEQIPGTSDPIPKSRPYNLYLHRPLTPASFAKVLAPLCPNTPLTEQLRKRDVLEFPTIHVFPAETEVLPAEYMLEKDFLAQLGSRPKKGADTKMRDVKEVDSSSSEESSEESSEDSSEESDSDESMEEGEVV